MDSTTDEKIVSVPYFVYEGEQTRMERINKRLVTVLIIVLLALVFTNAMWIYSWTQYDYACIKVKPFGVLFFLKKFQKTY